MDVDDADFTRQWHIISPAALAMYIILQLFISLKILECRLEEPFAPWIINVAISVFTCFLLAALSQKMGSFYLQAWAKKESGKTLPACISLFLLENLTSMMHTFFFYLTMKELE
jgi:hypothetical protein